MELELSSSISGTQDWNEKIADEDLLTLYQKRALQQTLSAMGLEPEKYHD